MSGVEFNGKIDQVNNITRTTTANIADNTPKTGAFGYGFEPSKTGFSRNVVPHELMAKFEAVNPPKYGNFGQLTISDKDYIPDGMFEETQFCEV